MDRCRQRAKATHSVLIIVQRNRHSITHSCFGAFFGMRCMRRSRKAAEGGGRAVGSEALIDSCLVAQDERCSSRFSRLRDRFLLHIARHAGEAAAEELLRGHELVRCSVSECCRAASALALAGGAASEPVPPLLSRSQHSLWSVYICSLCGHPRAASS